MSDKRGFGLVEFLMTSQIVAGFFLMATLIGVESARAVSKVSNSRDDAYYAAMRWDLKNLDARESIYFADRLSYSSSVRDLKFRTSDGVSVTVEATVQGWSATATHDALGPNQGCAVYFGRVPAPTTPVAPSRVGQLVCTG